MVGVAVVMVGCGGGVGSRQVVMDADMNVAVTVVEVVDGSGAWP